MRLAILDADTLGDDISLELFDSLGEVKKYGMTPADKVSERISDCDAVVVNKIRLFEDNLKNALQLKLICITATGYDNIDVDYCRRKGIAVCNVAAYSTDSVMQLTVSLVLSLVNHISEYDSYVKSGKYTHSGVQNYLKPCFHEISSMTWGIVGFGSIGKRVADAAGALGARVLINRRTRGNDTVDIDELCKKSDIITIHTPLTADTEHLIGKKQISVMKKGVVIVNAARGRVLDESAVAKAVEDGHIGGFAADVYSAEPLPEKHPYARLFKNSNVILTPHMAWGAYEARIRCLCEVKKNIEAYFSGEIRNRIC